MSSEPFSEGASSTARAVDAAALARIQRRLNAAASPPWLHGEAARRMAQRLPIIRLQPERIVDWNAFLGASGELLRQTYPRADITAVESQPERRELRPDRPWWQRLAGSGARPRAPADVPPGQAQLLWSNMALQGEIDPQATLIRWQQALAVDGFLMFSTLGPGSLAGLAEIYREHGWPAPFAPFVDMHDLGDMLVHAGFADPVMDQEQVTLTWPSAGALLAELRQLGGNIDLQRPAGLRTPRWRQRLRDALAARADASGRIALGFELVYGHAFKPPPRPKLAAQTTLPLDDMRAMVRAGRQRR